MKNRKTLAAFLIWAGAFGSLTSLFWWYQLTSAYLDQLRLRVSPFDYFTCAYSFGCPSHAHLDLYYNPLPALLALAALVAGILLKVTSSGAEQDASGTDRT